MELSVGLRYSQTGTATRESLCSWKAAEPEGHPPPWRSSLAPVFPAAERRTLALSSGRILVRYTIIVSTTRCAMPGRVVCSRSREGQPLGNRRGRDLIPIRHRNTTPNKCLAPQRQQVCWVEYVIPYAQADTQFHMATAQPKGMEKETSVRARPSLPREVICRLAAWTDTYRKPQVEPGPQAQPRPQSTAVQTPHSRGAARALPGPRASSQELGSLAPDEPAALLLGYGPPEFQQASRKRARPSVGLPQRSVSSSTSSSNLIQRAAPGQWGSWLPSSISLAQLHKHLG